MNVERFPHLHTPLSGNAPRLLKEATPRIPANLICNPYGTLNVGTEFLYGWMMLQNGRKADRPAHPVHVTLRGTAGDPISPNVVSGK